MSTTKTKEVPAPVDQWREVYYDASKGNDERLESNVIFEASRLKPGQILCVNYHDASNLDYFLRYAKQAPDHANLRFATISTIPNKIPSVFYEVNAEGKVSCTYNDKPDWYKSPTDLRMIDVLKQYEGKSLEEYFHDVLAKSPKERKKILSHDFMLQLDEHVEKDEPVVDNNNKKAGSAFTVADLSMEDFTWLVEYLNKAVSEKRTPDLPYFESVTTGRLSREQKFGIRTYYKAIVGRTLTARPGFTGDDQYFNQISEGLSKVKNIGLKKFHDKVSEVVAAQPNTSIKEFEVKL
ncbi:hypothetical protein [Enterobacter mori]